MSFERTNKRVRKESKIKKAFEEANKKKHKK